MAQIFHTVEELKKLATDYFTSNPDVDHLVASTHDGVFFRPENAGYCASNAAAAGGQVVRVDRFNEATPLTTHPVNSNVEHLVAVQGGFALDVASFFRAHLARVAGGEQVESVLKSLLAEFTLDAPEWVEGLDQNGPGDLDFPELPPVRSALAEAVASAVHIPGFFAQASATTAPASTEAPATSSTPAPASTKAPKAPKAPAAAKKATTKKATASTTAKATKAKSTATKAAE
jgi:hypothetical protein